MPGSVASGTPYIIIDKCTDINNIEYDVLLFMNVAASKFSRNHFISEKYSYRTVQIIQDTVTSKVPLNNNTPPPAT